MSMNKVVDYFYSLLSYVIFFNMTFFGSLLFFGKNLYSLRFREKNYNSFSFSEIFNFKYCV